MDKSVHFKWILNRINFYLERLAIFESGLRPSVDSLQSEIFVVLIYTLKTTCYIMYVFAYYHLAYIFQSTTMAIRVFILAS